MRRTYRPTVAEIMRAAKVKCWVPLLGLACPLFLLPNAQGATIVVTTLAQKVNSTGGCSLQEAIYSSNLRFSFDGVHGVAIDSTDPDHFITTECAVGTGNDTIILPTGYPLPTFQLTGDIDWDAYNYLGPTATPLIFSNLTIEGNGATLESAGGLFRLFAVGTASVMMPTGVVVSGTGSLTLRDLHIVGFRAHGGNGGDQGGGGGLGAGGAIYVHRGILVVDRCTFEQNGASGGNGGEGVEAGGGGGLGGRGGAGGVGPTSGGGGGGGGARGDGGSGMEQNGGGGGGGTVYPGGTGITAGGSGGYLCGGNGGDYAFEGNDGHGGKCPGGGGGAFGIANGGFFGFTNESGASGAYGGGGGGGGDNGGNGGFGGGGGAGRTKNGGNGGFGGGGGSAFSDALYGYGPGSGGPYGGRGSGDGNGGGGGGALGGAIFGDTANITVQNSTFANNFVLRGLGAWTANGTGAGAAIFLHGGGLAVENSTISLNHGAGNGGGVVVYGESSAGANFVLNNTIIASNGGNECYTRGSVNASGAGNLIVHNGSGNFGACPGVVSEMDPLLGPLQLNPPGITPTMAIPTNGPAFNTADASTSLSTDQRGVDRPQAGGFDIGAYEACKAAQPNEIACVILVNAPPQNTEPLTMAVSPSNGGTTTPSVGTINTLAGAAAIITASPNPGYAFLNWSGPVTNATSPSTTVLMNGPETVTANFTGCSCATNVSATVLVTRGSFTYDPATGRFSQNVTLQNNSPTPISGPVSLVLDSLSADAALFNSSGTTDAFQPPAGSSYINANTSLAPLQKVTLILQFTDPTKGAISYTTRVLAGPGQR